MMDQRTMRQEPVIYHPRNYLLHPSSPLIAREGLMKNRDESLLPSATPGAEVSDGFGNTVHRGVGMTTLPGET